MKLKKYLLMLPLLLMAVVMVTACGDDDDKKKDEPANPAVNALVGTWSDAYGSETYIFKADGTGTYMYTDSDGTVSETDTFTWSAVNGYLQVVYSDGDDWGDIYQLLNESTLNWGGELYYRR